MVMKAINRRRRTKIMKKVLMKLINIASTQKTAMKDYRETLTSKCSLTKGLPAYPSLSSIAYPSISHLVRKKMRKKRLKCRLKIMAMRITLTLLKTSNRDSLCLRLTTANRSNTSKNSTRNTKIHNKLLMMNAQ